MRQWVGRRGARRLSCWVALTAIAAAGAPALADDTALDATPDGATAGDAAAGDAAAGDAAAGDVAPEDAAPASTLIVSGSFEFEYDRSFAADPSLDAGDGTVTIEPTVTWALTDRFRLVTHLLFEPVLDPVPGESRFLGDQGLYARELYAEATIGRAEVAVGKLDPVFGWAWDVGPGLYGSDFGSRYQLTEALGGRVTMLLSSAPGPGAGDAATTVEQHVSASLFTADTTFLGDSLFTSRGRLSRADGGVGNTDAPQSFSVAYTYETLDGDGEIAGPSVQVALRRLAAGAGDGHDAWGFLASAQDRFDLGPDLSLTTIAEAAYFVHQDGGSQDGLALTLGGELHDGPWFVSASGSLADVQRDGVSPDYIATASVGRTFDSGVAGPLRVDLGTSYARVDGEIEQTIGIRLQKDFDVGF